MDRVRVLRNTVRDYAWGSRTALAELTGRASPSDAPEAELWMGAHAGAPSRVEGENGEEALGDWIARDPEAALGPEVVRRFGGELPFLFKVVAPERALSIQSHPDAEQARAGFARENAAGLALDDPARSYRDPHHKPEIACALTPFQALCGFRPISEIVDGVAALRIDTLEAPVKELRQAPDRAGLAAFFAHVMTREASEREALARAVARAAARGGAEPAACATAARLAEQYPGDPGVLAPFLLNRFELAPGEALFLPAGELHCYLEGVAIEAMANSDNVLRGGLTPKHVDVPELLRTLSFRAGRPAVLRPREVAPGLAVYDTPAAEFRLSVLRPGPARAVVCNEPHSAEILLCTDGAAVVVDEARGERTPLARGAAAFVPAAVGRYRVEGEATLHRAGVPQ